MNGFEQILLAALLLVARHVLHHVAFHKAQPVLVDEVDGLNS